MKARTLIAQRWPSFARFVGVAAAFAASTSFGAEYLVRLNDNSSHAAESFASRNGGKMKVVSQKGSLYRWTTTRRNALSVRDNSAAYIQKNFNISLFANPSLIGHEQEYFAEMKKMAKDMDVRATPKAIDNPAILPPIDLVNIGPDPLLEGSWGLEMIAAPVAWEAAAQGEGVIVAVIDTGVDYNHEDLRQNMWRNEAEIEGDGIDNDGNGYIDDIVGWDFAVDDSKPFDMTTTIWDTILRGGNAGHGTHCSGVVAARGNNSLGIAGVAPHARIMALRFLGEKGQGSTEGAIKAIDYAVANGARVINASWGGEAEGADSDKALEEAIGRARDAGVIFVAAAGNGRQKWLLGQAEGFDLDIDDKPVFPAAYEMDNLVTVAAIDDAVELAPFSNYGARLVKLAAPGVKIQSTVPGNKYSDTVIDMGFQKVTWDGTSMAAPHVSGALAVLISQDPTASYSEIIERLLTMTVGAEALYNKVSSNGRLDLSAVGPSRKFAR